MSDDSLMLLALIGVGVYLFMQKEQPPVTSAGTKIGETIGTIAQDIGKEAKDISKQIEEGWKKDVKPFFDTTIPQVFKQDVKPVFTTTIPNVFKNEVTPFFGNVSNEIKKDVRKVEDTFKKAGSKIKSFFHF
jgi:hypothetical protein